MPGTYRCPRGGNHEWVKKTGPGNVTHQVCRKCGAKRPG